MSNVVDSRVVEMRFDNKNFEQNVQTSMSTLEKLKSKLKLTGASKGMENLSTAAKNVNLNPLGSAVETVQAKFSALQIIGITALQNITNSAINAGKHIVSALTIDPIKTGLSEYEQKMNAIQVIQSNTRGKNNLDEINEALNDLNTYADKTIYNFAQMTSNIGKFTAQGLDVFQAADAVKGMANLAAASGASAEDMSRATYQMSQALGSSIKLMDWNSLRNANMATVELKNTLIDLAKVHGVAIDDMIAKEGSFEQTLSSGWLTGEMFTEAMNIYSGVYSDAELKAKGFTDAQIKNFNELAAMAESAATEVKTFTQLWDVLKETAQSGWAQTWELIFGDFEESKKMFTQLQVFFSGIIDGWSDARNTFLGGVFNISKPWSSIVDKLEGSGLGKIKKVADSVQNLTHKLEDFQDIVHKVWMGDYGNSDTGRFEKLNAEGWDYRVVQDLVNKGIDYKITMEDVEASHKKFGITLSETNEEAKKTTETFEKLSDRQLKHAGLTEAEIKLYRQLEAESARTGKSISELVDEMSKVDGRTLLIDSFKNIGRALGSIFYSIKKAWQETFEPVSFIRVYSALATLKEKTRDIANFITRNTDQLTRTFKGVFAIIDIITTLIGGGFKIALKAISALLGMFDLNILDVTANVGDAIVAFRDWLDSVLDFTEIFESMKDIFSKAVKGIKEWIETLKTSDNLPRDIINGVVNGLKFGLSVIGDAAKAIGEKIIEGIKSALEYFGIDTSFIDNFIEKVQLWFDSFKDADGIPSNIIQGIINGFKSGASAVFSAVIEFAKGIIEKVKGVLGIHSPSTVFFEMAANCVTGFINGIIEGAKKVFSVIKEFASKIIDAFKESDGVSSGDSSFTDKVKEYGSKLLDIVKTVFGSIFNFLKSVDPGTLIAVGLIATTLYVAKKLSDAIVTLSKPLTGFSDMCSSIGDAFKALKNRIKGNNFQNIAKGVRTLAEAILILSVSIFLLASLDYGKLWSAVGAMVVIAGVLAGLAFIVNKMNGVSMKIDASATFTIIALAGSLLLIAFALKKLSDIDPERFTSMLKGLAVAISALALVFGAASLTLKNNKTKDLDGLGKLLFKMALSLLVVIVAIKLISKLDESAIEKGLTVIAAVELLFAAVIAVSKLAGEYGKSAGSMLLKMSFALLIMVGVVKLASKLKESEIKRGISLIGKLELLFAAVIAVSKLAGEHASKAGSMILKMSIALLLAVTAVKYAGSLDEKDAEQGLKVVGILEALFGALIAVSHLAGQNATKVGIMLIAMSFALLIVVGIMYLLTKFDSEGLKRGLGAISLLEGLFAGIVGLSYYAKDVKPGTMWAMVGAIAVLAIAVGTLSLIEEDKLKTSTGCMALLMGALALLVASTSSLNGVKLSSFIPIISLVGLLAGIVWLLSELKVETSIETAGALALLMGTMTGLTWILSKANVKVSNAIKGAIALTSLAIPLYAFAEALKKLPDTSYCSSNVLMLVGVTTAMTLLLIPLTMIGTLASSAIKGVLSLTAMAAPLFLFVETLKGMDGIQNALEKVKALVLLMGALTLMLVPLTMIGSFIITALLGVTSLTALAIPMLAFIGVIALMESIPNAIANINALVNLMKTLTGMLAILAIVGPLALTGIAALGVLELLMIATGAFAVAIGALFEKFPVLEKFLDTGIDILIKIAAGIGEMAAALISAFTNNLDLSNLVNIGNQLSAFAVAISPFMSFAKSIAGWDTVGGVAILAATILAFTGVDLVSGIAELTGLTGNLVSVGHQLTAFGVSIMPFMALCASLPETALTGATVLCSLLLKFTLADLINGIGDLLGLTGNLVDVGQQLSAFGISITPFLATIRGVSENDVAAARSVADLVLALTRADLISGFSNLLSFFTGGGSFSTLGPELVTFGDYIKQFSDKVKNIDDASVIAAAKAAEILVELSQNIPSDCDWMDTLFGNNDMDHFGEQITVFAESMSAASAALIANPIDEGAINVLKSAGLLMTELAAEVPTQHGEGTLWGSIAGSNDIGEFGSKVVDFANAMGDASAALVANPIDTTSMDTLKSSGELMTALAEQVPTQTGDNTLWGFIKGSDDLSDFGEKIKSFAENMGAVSTALTDNPINEEAINTAKKTGDLFVELDKAIPEDGWFDGKVTLSEFGDEMIGYAESIKEMTEELEGVDVTTAQKTASIGTTLATIAKRVQSIDTSKLESFDVAPLGKAIGDYYENVKDVVPSKITASTTAITSLINSINKMASLNTTGVGKFKTAVADLGSTNIKDIQKTFKQSTSQMVSSGVDIVNSIAKGMKTSSSSLTNAASSIVTNMNKNIASKLSTFVKTGAAIVTNISNGLRSKMSIIKSSIESVLSSCVSKIQAKYSSMYNAGSYVMQGLANGIANNGYRAVNKAQEIANKVTEIVNEAFGVASPSKVFYAIGNFVVQGFTNALRDGEDSVHSSATSISETAKKAFNRSMVRVLDALNGNMELQPTIRPVIDTSGIEAGARSINGMFGMSPSVNTLSTVGAINSMMNQRIQNGTNSDVVSAIDKLRKDLNNVGNTSYNINGITYDDGSNISNAVETLIRAARIERRV